MKLIKLQEVVRERKDQTKYKLKIQIMKKEQILGLVRHALTIIGGALIAKGYVEEDIVGEVIGSVMSLTGVIWSIMDKKK
jgi:hypothetical protein